MDDRLVIEEFVALGGHERPVQAEQLAELQAHVGANKRRQRLKETRPELSLDVEAAVMAAEKRVGVGA